MSAEHRGPLVAFLVLSTLCLVVAAAGLRQVATQLPALNGGEATLLAGGTPEHLAGKVLVGRTSAGIPLGNDRPVVPATVALPAAAPAVDAAPAPTAAAPSATPADAPPAPGPRRHRAQESVHQRAQHTGQRRTTDRRPVAQRRTFTPAPTVGPGHAAHSAAPAATDHGRLHPGSHSRPRPHSLSRQSGAVAPPGRHAGPRGHALGHHGHARGHRVQHPGRHHGWSRGHH
jgi:hypothetical protein